MSPLRMLRYNSRHQFSFQALIMLQKKMPEICAFFARHELHGVGSDIGASQHS
jgi:hypothetical protein